MSTMTDNDNALLQALQAFVAPAPAEQAPTIPNAIAAQAVELDALRNVLKIMKEREETIRASLLDFLKTEGVESVTDGTVSINLSKSTRTGIDKKRLEALYPKVLAQVETKTPVTQLRVTIKG